MSKTNLLIPEILISDNTLNIKIEKIEFSIINNSKIEYKWECHLNNFDGWGSGDTPFEAFNNAVEDILENEKEKERKKYLGGNR